MRDGRTHRKGWLLGIAVLAIAGAVYAVGAGSPPELAEYDVAPPAAPAAAPVTQSAPDSIARNAPERTAPPETIRPAETRATARVTASSASPSRAPTAPSPDSVTTRDSTASPDSTSVARPHRSENYGGYRGYGGFSRPARPRSTAPN